MNELVLRLTESLFAEWYSCVAFYFVIFYLFLKFLFIYEIVRMFGSNAEGTNEVPIMLKKMVPA